MVRPAAGPAICALGYAAAVSCYLPLLTLLLPLRVEAIAPASRFGVLAAASIAGAVVAAGTNILFGALSDRSIARGGTRRGWIAAGLAATLASYAAIARVETAAGVVVAVMLFQAAMNLLLAPLLALIAEEIPDARKGYAAGLLAGAHPAAALLCALLVAVGPGSMGGRLAAIGAIAAAGLLPLLLSVPGEGRSPPLPPVPAASRDLVVAWGARLAFQIAGGVLFVYLLYVMEAFADGGDPAALSARIAGLMATANLLPLPVTLVLGRFSDRLRQRKPFIVATAALAAAGLAAMASADAWRGAAIGYGLYAIGNGAFLALQIGFVMELLPNPRHRGRDLGFVNLANTIPALIGPALTWWLATPGSPALLLLSLAALSLAGGLAMLAVRSRR